MYIYPGGGTLHTMVGGIYAPQDPPNHGEQEENMRLRTLLTMGDRRGICASGPS